MAVTMTFMQFQKLLKDRGIDGHTAYILTIMYEQLIEMGKQLDMCANVTLATVETLENSVNLNEAVLQKVKGLRDFGKEDGIDVRSVVADPEDTEH